jgi:hypothetical protein
VFTYNKHKTGVHNSDQLMLYCSLQIHFLKWYKIFFIHFFQFAIVNQISHNKKSNEQIWLQEFCKNVAGLLNDTGTEVIIKPETTANRLVG